MTRCTARGDASVAATVEAETRVSNGSSESNSPGQGKWLSTAVPVEFLCCMYFHTREREREQVCVCTPSRVHGEKGVRRRRGRNAGVAGGTGGGELLRWVRSPREQEEEREEHLLPRLLHQHLHPLRSRPPLPPAPPGDDAPSPSA
ncbi:hypothetical protein BHM03_00006515 [Ensete ventricosum]|nr:hypothetical protein BHM03_00006515 [Ensete ventricosum]